MTWGSRKVMYDMWLLLLAACLWMGIKGSVSATELTEEPIPAATSEIIYYEPVKLAQQLPVSQQSFENPQNSYNSLKVPTQITRIGDYYFLTDCYHNQVLYTQKLGAPVQKWKVMTTDVEQPHSIAGDGQVYLVVDTENNRVQVFEWEKGRFQNTQRLEGIGKRPHYIAYDKETQAFYIWSSLTGEMYIAKREADTGKVFVSEVRRIKELDGYYVRSFTIVGEQILFPSGNNCAVIAADKDTLEVQARYPVPGEISGMAYILPIGDYFYMTVSSDLNYDQDVATIIRCRDLSLLAQGGYEDVCSYFPNVKIPYYIDRFNGMYYMTSAGNKKMIWHFNVADNRITDVGSVY